MERLKKWMNSLPGGILFCLLVLCIVWPLSYCLRTNGEIKDIFTGFYAEPEDSIDVVMIGSSPVYPSMAGAKLWEDHGITAYPLSSNMQRPKAGIHLVKEAEQYQNPSLYVFELRMYTGPDERLTENMAYTRGVTDNLRYSLNRKDTIDDLVPAEDAEGRLSYYLDILKYHSNWRTLVQPSQLATWRYKRQNPLKGAVIKKDVGPAQYTDVSAVTERQAIPEEQEQTLRELTAYLKSIGKDALFVVVPNNLDEEKQAMYNYIADILAQEGFGYLNMNDHLEEMDFDFEKDFADEGGHTNAYGMEKVSRYLGDYLAAHYDIPDKRGTAGYESWDAAAELWEAEIGRAEATIESRYAAGLFWTPENE